MSSFKRLAMLAQKTTRATLNAARTSIAQTMEQNKQRALTAEQQREEEKQAKSKGGMFAQLTSTQEMSVVEAVQVLGLEDKELSAELIDERHRTMIDINEDNKHTSPYLIAKINNAKVAATKQFEKPAEPIKNSDEAVSTPEHPNATSTKDQKL